MAKSIKQVEKNTQASFGYVKKDLLMLNDSVSDIHDKIQHLSLNHASLLEKFQKIENELVKLGKKETRLEKATKKDSTKTSSKKSSKTSKTHSKNTNKRTIKKTTKKSPKKVTKTEEIVYS